MDGLIRVALAEAESLASAALIANGTAGAVARATARALVATEADGQAAHGLSRVPAYALQARSGKVQGAAVPQLLQPAADVLRIDAGLALANPAVDLALSVAARGKIVAAQKAGKTIPEGWAVDAAS